MSENSSIEWTHHTFNPWWGCVKVSPGCQHCYAESFSKRVGNQIWGKKAPRRFFAEKKWRQPIQWNAKATKEGERKRVFCASMADVFEDRRDLNPWREKLWDLILKTPMLDWLLLTKRPENIEKMVPWTDDWPENIWLGTTVENQEYADERLPHLLKHKSKVRFLSCEPLLGPVNLKGWINPKKRKSLHGIDWIIAGGESGAGARPMNPNWIRNLRDQAKAADVPILFKQWGQWAPTDHLAPGKYGRLTTIDGIEMSRLKSRKQVSRVLDGRYHDEYPTVCLTQKISSPKNSPKSSTTPQGESNGSYDPDTHPDFPDESITGFLNGCRGWDITLNKNFDVTTRSKLTHPDFPGISLTAIEFMPNDSFDLLLATIYKQAVDYGKSIAQDEILRKLGPKTKSKS